MLVRTKDGLVEMTEAEALAYADSLKTPEEKKQEQIAELQANLDSTDYSVLQRTREKELNIPTTLTDAEYLALEQQRQTWVVEIRELEA